LLGRLSACRLEYYRSTAKCDCSSRCRKVEDDRHTANVDVLFRGVNACEDCTREIGARIAHVMPVLNDIVAQGMYFAAAVD
jgi:hypothetical protein